MTSLVQNGQEVTPPKVAANYDFVTSLGDGTVALLNSSGIIEVNADLDNFNVPPRKICFDENRGFEPLAIVAARRSGRYFFMLKDSTGAVSLYRLDRL